MTRTPARTTWRQRVAHAGSGRAALAAGLAVGAGFLVGSRLRPWLAYHGGLVEDVDTVLRQARSARGWRRAWQRIAEERALVADEAGAVGRHATAFRHGVAAAIAYQSAVYLTPEDEAPRTACLAAGANVYGRALAHAPWVVDAVPIPWRGHTLPGWLHRPRDVARPPVVVVVNAIGHYKETWTGLAHALTSRGVAVLAFDGPGEGAHPTLASPLHAEEILTPVRDALGSRADVDAERAGLLGISLAGGLVARATACDARWRACAAIAPPYDPSRYAASLPRFLQKMVAIRAGLAVSDLVARASELSLQPVAQRITAPLFVVESHHDWLVPTGEGARLVADAASKRKELVVPARGAHAGIHDFHLVMDRAADFLADVLRE